MHFPTVEKNLTIAFSDKTISLEDLLRRLKLDPSKIVSMHQVHGNRLAWVGKKDLDQKIPETDALVAAEKGIFLTVRVADCIPVLLFDPKTKVVAAVHVGWRGLLNDITVKVIADMKCEGIEPVRLMAYLGPAARSCCYEVGQDLAEQFRERFGNEVVIEENRKIFLDLQLVLKKQLIQAGVRKENIFDSGVCTIHNSDRYYSFRADKKLDSNVALIGYDV